MSGLGSEIGSASGSAAGPPYVPPAWDPRWASPSSTLRELGGHLTARRAPQEWHTTSLLMTSQPAPSDPPASARGPREEQQRGARAPPFGPKPRFEALAAASIPGYGGYLPGREANNVYGVSRCRGNAEAPERASRAWATAATPGAGTSPRTPAEPRLGARRQLASLPGYTGHVPGRVAEHAFGASFRRETAMCLEGSPRKWPSAAGRGAKGCVVGPIVPSDLGPLGQVVQR